MYKIAFFCIPAYGHTNPTLEVVRELTVRGHQVRYFSYELFREKIESAGAEFIPCDQYDVPVDLSPEKASQVGTDLRFSVQLLVNTALALDKMVCENLEEWKPDCVIADSMAVWGKFAALKLQLPFISSTTTFAFNRYSAKIMPQSFSRIFDLLKAMPSVNHDLKRLREHGYPVKNILSIIQNDNDTNTIVYTSKEFQPCSETFSDKYVFVGPSINAPEQEVEKTEKKTVYISLGTVNNRMPDFYSNCIKAFEHSNYRIIISAGKDTDIASLGHIPGHITIQNYVDQISVLQAADVFLSHCGMNSVNESLYYQVPLVLFPQTAEQEGVANRVKQLHAGLLLEGNTPEFIRNAVDTVLTDDSYQKSASEISRSFMKAGGAPAAAEAVLRFLNENNIS